MTQLVWLAVVDGLTGYALDVYPEERARYQRQLGDRIIGEFDSHPAAMRAVHRRLKAGINQTMFSRQDAGV